MQPILRSRHLKAEPVNPGSALWRAVAVCQLPASRLEGHWGWPLG